MQIMCLFVYESLHCVCVDVCGVYFKMCLFIFCLCVIGGIKSEYQVEMFSTLVKVVCVLLFYIRIFLGNFLCLRMEI